MIAALPLSLTSRNCSAIVGCVVRFVVPLRFFGDDGKEKRLLPFGRFAGAVKPCVSGLSWTPQRGDDDGSGIRGERFSEGHGEILPSKKKSAMQKINLAKCPQCRQITCMSATLQAPQGGELHNLSDKFYLGGQFMPEQDVMAGAKRKASKAAAKFEIFGNPSIGMELRGQLPVSVEVAGRNKVIAWASNQEEAEAMRDTLRKVIETRLGGKELSWN